MTSQSTTPELPGKDSDPGPGDRSEEAADAVLLPRLRGAGKPKIEGYELEEVLGRGAMGTVYRARQLSVDREVALKILHPELVARSRIVRRMQREARMTARLAHPNLVSAVDMGTLNGRLWYAMEFVDGPTLSLRLREEGRLSEREALRLFIPLCEALGHLSEHGIVHRDVKPSNILLDRKGGARLADLGLAFADEDPQITKHGGTLGTPQYISPEQAVDPSQADVRSDLWSFGATMFHAVCGRPPFAGESTAEVLSAVLYERVPDPRELEPSLSRGFCLVLRKCLASEPEARYQTPQDLLADLERVRERRQPRVRRSALDPVASQADRRPLYLVLAALVLVVVGVLVGQIGNWNQNRQREKAEKSATQHTSPLLDGLERRLAEGNSVPGALMREHAALEEDVPESMHARWLDLGARILDAVGERAQDVGRELEVELESAIANGDYLGAWNLTRDAAERRLRLRTGLSSAELLREIPASVAWIDGLRERTEEAEGLALERLARALFDHEQELEREVSDLLEQQQWSAALDRLEFDREALLSSIGFRDHAFRPDRLEAALVELKTWTKIRRDRVSDHWRALDRELRGAVVQRADRLRQDLLGEGSAFSAAAELVLFFEQELSRRRLSIEGMPKSLPRTAWDALNHEVGALRVLEDGRLEADARQAIKVAEEATEEAWRQRDLATVKAGWLAVRERLRREGGLTGTDWRAELELEVAGRLLEAELVENFLANAAEALIERDGSLVDLRLRGVKYSQRFLRAGTDPLRLGFRLEGLEEVVHLQDLTARELARFCGLEQPAQLGAEGCVALAALMVHDGQERAGLDLLRSERPNGSLEVQRLALDLAVRATDALERGAPKARAAEGAEAGNAERTRAASAGVPRGPEALGAEVVDLRGGRQRLNFDFQRPEVGAWTSDGWIFDGLSWTHGTSIATVADFEQEQGLSLSLDPLMPHTGSLTARFELEHSAGSGPSRLVVFEVDGVFVALVGEALPGVPGNSRILVETAGLYALLERAQDRSEGREIERPLGGEQKRVLEIEVGPRRTRVSVRFQDGESLVLNRQVRAPTDYPHRISIRAWEPLRLHSVGLEL